jgi:hypothetical protein
VTINENSIAFITDLVVTNIVDTLAKQSGKSTTETLRELMKTKTYTLLLNSESYLYLESPTYVLDMIDAERSGDWKRWLEV